MGLSLPQTIYGVHSLTLYNRATYEPYGIMKVVGSLGFEFSGDFKDLFGGSSRYAWDSEGGVLGAMLKGTVKECPNFAFEKFLGGAATKNVAEASGNFSTVTNRKGTSVKSATTGIATVAAKTGKETDLKTGTYVIKCVTATTVDVYAMSDYDFSNGTAKAFESDLCKITASPLTIVASTGAEVPGFGIELTGGSGTIGMTIGDTASFEVRRINAGSDEIVIGQSTATFPAFGALIAAQPKASGDTFEVHAFNCRGIGFPVSLKEMDWVSHDISIKCLIDPVENAVAKIRRVRAA